MSDGRVDLRTDQPHSARMYDYYLGGKDNYEADRVAAERVMQEWPSVVRTARTNRDFMRRATRYLAGQGIRQFLDIGTGIPTAPNLHQVAQEIVPDARIVYVDNDPIVLAHARALLVGSKQGRTAYIDADATDPQSILGAPELRDTLDFTRPVALSVISLVHFVPGDGVYDIIRTLMQPLAPGSYLAMTHFTADFDPEGVAGAVRIYHEGGIGVEPRSRVGVDRFFEGLELVEPGVAQIHRWRPDGIEPPKSRDWQVPGYAALARKP